jgi:hypothetical protein
MLTRRQCAFRKPTGEPCQSPPLHDSQFCFMHSPEHAQEAQEARKLGGVRRKREVTLAGAYEFDGINTVQGIQRILEIAMLDTLAMENSLSRNRTLAYLALAAMKALEVGVQEERITALEQAVQGRQIEHEQPIFDVEKRLLESGDKEAK